MIKNKKIAIIGLGYVGLPLAVEFGKKFNTFGFDIDKNRIKELSNFYDKTLEVSEKDLKSSKKINFSFKNEYFQSSSSSKILTFRKSNDS